MLCKYHTSSKIEPRLIIAVHKHARNCQCILVLQSYLTIPKSTLLQGLLSIHNMKLNGQLIPVNWRTQRSHLTSQDHISWLLYDQINLFVHHVVKWLPYCHINWPLHGQLSVMPVVSVPKFDSLCSLPAYKFMQQLAQKDHTISGYVRIGWWRLWNISPEEV